MFSRQIEVCQNNANKIDNFSRELKVCQNNVNKSNNFSRETEVCLGIPQILVIFLLKLGHSGLIELNGNLFFVLVEEVL